MLDQGPLAGTRLDQLDLGRVIEVSGAGAEVMLDAPVLRLLAGSPDMGLAASGQVGGYVKLRIGNQWAVAAVRSLRLAQADGDLLLGQIDFVGEGLAMEDGLTGFRRGLTRLPVPGDRMRPVSTADLAAMFATGERPHVRIGRVHRTEDIPAALYVDPLLGRHFALLGSTGTGKSTAAAMILHRVGEAAPHGHVLMIDPHGEYAEAFGDAAAVFDTSNLQLPYWLMNLAEHAEILVTARGPERQGDIDLLARCLLAARAKNRAAEGIAKLTADSPVPYLLSDLGAIITAEMGKLEKAAGNAPYLRLKARIEEVKADPRYAFLLAGMMVGDNMGPFLARILRLAGEGKPIAIVDVSGVPSEITSVVVAMLARLVFDHALWSRGPASRPVLLVCEEAHRYIPAEGDSPARLILERIAKEGRKYGVALGLVTQRPSDLAEGVLSQCGTIIAMRLNNDRDRAHVRAALPDSAHGLADAIPALRNREAIVCGEGVAVPVRVSLDPLPEAQRPASNDPIFSDLWRIPADVSALDGTIVRWRRQGR